MTFRRWSEQVGQAVLDSIGRVASRVQEHSPLPADLLESEDAFLIVFDAPGVEARDVQVQYERGTVHARIERARDSREGFELRFPGRGLSLDGTVELPPGATVDPLEATATLTTHGTLRVELPKEESESDQPVAIDTEGESESAPEAPPGAETPDGA